LNGAAPRVAVLISGEGSNLQALLDAERAGHLGAHVALVVCDRAGARGLDRARAAGVEARHLPAAGQRREAYDERLGAVLADHAPELVVLAGFMRILGAAFVERLAGRLINLHPSLLPAYRGLDTHRRVLAAGERWHGATVHFVTAELDAGPPILQYRIPVRAGDTEATLSARVHVGEHIILPRTVEWFAAGRLSLEGSSAILDGAALTQPIIMEGDA
jgi:phosphoribosylglycinamide formyltransferase 1